MSHPVILTAVENCPVCESASVGRHGTVGSASVAIAMQQICGTPKVVRGHLIRGSHLRSRVLGLFQLLDERVGVVFSADTALARRVGQ